MYISDLSLHNFRCFAGDNNFKFTKGMNYLVGNNNSGKTTIFKAVDFLLHGSSVDNLKSIGLENEELYVQATLSELDEESICSNKTLAKLSGYIDDSTIVIKRSSETTKGTKGVKSLLILNPKKNSFETFTGIDKAISSLFDTVMIYCDLKNDEYQDFSKTKTIGKLINAILQDFTQKPEWAQLKHAHEIAFGESGIKGDLSSLASEIESVISSQYGDTEVTFDFDLPPVDAFLKNGKLLASDNGVQTEVSEKGTGMQRAIALALIQVYSERSTASSAKSIIFFVDEPETYLHPQAQDNMLTSFDSIANNSQLFITTHSPYLLRSFNSDKHKLIVFCREGNRISTRDEVAFTLFPYSPTWGEINYKAFGIASVEFHIELFGLLHEKLKSNQQAGVGPSIKSVDEWLSKQPNAKLTDSNHRNIPPKGSKADKTMTVYIRNYFDHPGDDPNPSVTRQKPTVLEISDSIGFMLSLIPTL